MSASLAVDYFAVFGLPPVFAQDPAELERRYLDLQRSAHPDRYAHLNATERRAAVEAAARVTRLCLDDIERNGMMHENYHADTGRPLAAPDFISWNLLAAQMLGEARRRIFRPDPAQAVWND